ncbi:phosphoribosylaminoimidazole carboxylase [Mycena sanguinolenta]|uniref:Phosphoribosylaminoimidazole carboxylase n=1 Tax=Mycena sanguinolenta TaxID=230812 RepID=A0A8H6YA56_9AGAR|nr:phosphoribosylaminoimidazole carboxylase [Mycena sanguinolenta]
MIRGGQLGRMLAAAASLLNIKIVILDVGEHAPAKQVLAPISTQHAHIDGSFTDQARIRELAAKVDVLTIEIEHVDADALAQANCEIHPSPATIKLIQDKLAQKQHLQSHGCPVSDFVAVDSTIESIHTAARNLGLPLMLKSRTLAYDGRGNFVLRELSEAPAAIAALGNRPLYAEKWVPFTHEIAVMVVRSTSGEVRAYPVVETVHKENVCHLVFAPLRTRDPTLSRRAQVIAEDAIKTFEGAGVFGVELFLMGDGGIYINEIAPRPHNSGHYTIEACETSQYENHLRAILSLPLGSTALKVPSCAMLNIIGLSSSMDEVNALRDVALTVPGASVHLYGKSECRKGRKMGHITVVAESDAELRTRLRVLLDALPSSPVTETDLDHPLVGVIMGSDSDLPVMLPAARILDQFQIPYELTIVSAHRTPDRLVEYARSASSRALRTIIAGAGGAAHLPGMVAAMTALPVIGVPVKGSTLDGVDSLHSIVQMPRGIPVATVAINNGTNAGLLAVRILAAGIPRLVDAMDTYLKNQESEVLGKVEKLKEAMDDQDRFILLASLWIVYTVALLLIIWAAVAGSKALRRTLYTTPLLGHTRSSVGSVDIIAKSAQAYGPVFLLPTGRFSNKIVLCDPTAIAHFYANAPAIYRSTTFTRRSTKNLVGRGLSWAEGEHHPLHRQALAPVFSSSAVEGFCSTFLNTVNKVRDVWETALESRRLGMVVDIQHWMNSVVLNSLGIVGFGHDFASLKGDYCIVTAAFYTLRVPSTNSPSDIIFRLASSIPILRNIPTAKNRIIKDFQVYISGIARDVLERNATKGHTEDKSILGMLIKSLAEHPAGEFRLSHTEVMAQNTLLFSGFETTAISLSWLLVELAKNPAIQDKLRQELRQVSRNFESSEIVKLPYLHTIIDEALRLHSPLGDTTRVLKTTSFLSAPPIMTKSKETVTSIRVAKGTVVSAPIQYINTSETFWGLGASKFDPGRWRQDKSNNNFPGNRHLAFGDGPRICIGANFALALMKVVVYGIVSNFTPTLPDGPQAIIECTEGRVPQPRMVGRGTEVSMAVRSVKQCRWSMEYKSRIKSSSSKHQVY